MIPIAYMKNDFPSKFGIPRQSGLVPQLRGEIHFTPAFSRPEAVRGLEAFSHIWLLWGFSEVKPPADAADWSPTVRPPRLGGNQRVGVFATRSPFRPNRIGLSCVELAGIRCAEKTVILDVRGADLLDGTPIFDIKPYIPFADCHPEATEGYTAQTRTHQLRVDDPAGYLSPLPDALRETIVALLAGDPRPGYSSDPQRIYGIPYAGYDIHFRVSGDVLTVCAVVQLSNASPTAQH